MQIVKSYSGLRPSRHGAHEVRLRPRPHIDAEAAARLQGGLGDGLTASAPPLPPLRHRVLQPGRRQPRFWTNQVRCLSHLIYSLGRQVVKKVL